MFADRRAHPGAGEVLPLPVFRYRRLRIQGGQGRGGFGYRLTVQASLIVNSAIYFIVDYMFVKIESKVADRFY